MPMRSYTDQIAFQDTANIIKCQYCKIGFEQKEFPSERFIAIMIGGRLKINSLQHRSLHKGSNRIELQ